MARAFPEITSCGGHFLLCTAVVRKPAEARTQQRWIFPEPRLAYGTTSLLRPLHHSITTVPSDPATQAECLWAIRGDGIAAAGLICFRGNAGVPGVLFPVS